jgi:hypothetical protein
VNNKGLGAYIMCMGQPTNVAGQAFHMWLANTDRLQAVQIAARWA